MAASMSVASAGITVTATPGPYHTTVDPRTGTVPLTVEVGDVVVLMASTNKKTSVATVSFSTNSSDTLVSNDSAAETGVDVNPTQWAAYTTITTAGTFDFTLTNQVGESSTLIWVAYLLHSDSLTPIELIDTAANEFSGLESGTQALTSTYSWSDSRDATIIEASGSTNGTLPLSNSGWTSDDDGGNANSTRTLAHGTVTAATNFVSSYTLAWAKTKASGGVIGYAFSEKLSGGGGSGENPDIIVDALKSGAAEYDKDFFTGVAVEKGDYIVIGHASNKSHSGDHTITISDTAGHTYSEKGSDGSVGGSSRVYYTEVTANGSVDIRLDTSNAIKAVSEETYLWILRPVNGGEIQVLGADGKASDTTNVSLDLGTETGYGISAFVADVGVGNIPAGWTEVAQGGNRRYIYSNASASGQVEFVADPARDTKERQGAAGIILWSYSSGTPSESISVSEASKDLDETAQSHSFDVTSDADWSWASSESWLSSTEAKNQNGDQEFTYSVTKNDSGNDRSGTITFTTTDGTQATHTVNQITNPTLPNLSADPLAQAVDFQAANLSFDVKANVTWTWSSADSWISSSEATDQDGDQLFTFAVSENTTAAERVGTITITSTDGSNLTSTHTITQSEPPFLTITDTDHAFDETAGSHTVDVSSNSTWSWASSDNWITSALPADQTGNVAFAYNVAANPNATARSGTITFTGAGVTLTHSITQKGKPVTPPYLTIDEAAKSFDYKAASHTVTVSSNVSWSWTTSQPWITSMLASDQTGDVAFKYSIEANPDITERIGTITFTGAGKTLTHTITQGATPPSLTISENTKSFDVKAGSNTFDVKSNTSWTWSSSDKWITSSEDSNQDNDQQFTYSVSENTSKQRMGTITFTSKEGVVATHTITQDGVPFLTISETGHVFDPTGGNNTIDVSSNTSWTWTASDTWITSSHPADQTGDVAFAYKVEANPELTTRSGTITFTGAGKTLTHTITQGATPPSLTISENTKSFDVKAGSNTFDVKSNTSWTWSSSDKWITSSEDSNQDNDQQFTYSVSENTSKQRMGTITFTSKEGVVATHTITQDGVPFLTISETGHVFDPTGGNNTIDVSSNTSWTWTASDTWITSSHPADQTGDVAFAYKVEANPELTTRSGTITFKGSGTTLTHIVTQNGADVVAKPDDSGTSAPTTPAAPNAGSKGKYTGFIVSTDGSKVLGYVKSLKLNASGKFSGSMYFNNVKYKLKGEFDENGNFKGTIEQKNQKPALVDFQFAKTEKNASQINGTVTVNGVVGNLTTFKASALSIRAGKYTILVLADKSDAASPQGNGYATMKISTNSSVKIKGVLADGEKWTAKTVITPDAEFPIYSLLYNKSGSLAGMAYFRDLDNVSDFDSNVIWHKPGKFAINRSLIGSGYRYGSGYRLIKNVEETRPNTEAILETTNGTSSWGLEWTSKNKLLYSGDAKVKLKIKKGTGMISGKIPDGNVEKTVKGVVFQKQNLASGFASAKTSELFHIIAIPPVVPDPPTTPVK